MNDKIAEPDNEEQTKLEILEVFKTRFVGEHGNCSPFAEDVVVRYDTNVDALDVPEIHQEVRSAIEDFVTGIHNGDPSKIVILAGDPGMGKSHLVNHYRSPELAQQLGYVLVGNSNHWSVQDFETCLLDWILDALIRPSPNENHLLLERIQDIAFETLSHILTRPGRLREFVGRKDAGFWRRQWAKLFGSGVSRYHAALKNRDDTIFRRLDFHAFAGEVIKRFLPAQASHPFHRHVLKCLLLYLFPEEREKVIHWLRKKNVENHFVKRLGIGENIEKPFQVIDIIKILVTLFSPAVSKGIHRQGTPTQGLVFFFAFDQMEGRNKLFEDDRDWLLFFDKLSELYNALPNIFFMFTMTLQLRNRLYPDMERQFRSRIVRGDKFLLQRIPNDEILAVYRRRIARWLGDANTETLSLLEDQRYRYLPFQAQEIAQVADQKTLREFLVAIDERFQHFLEEHPTRNTRLQYLVSLNRLRDKAKAMDAPFRFTENHLGTVTELMNRAGGMLASSFGLSYTGMEPATTEDGLKALRLEFRNREVEDQWVRVFLVALKRNFRNHLKSCVDLISGRGKAVKQNLLWLVRPKAIDDSIESERQGQIFVRVLELESECALQAMLKLLDKSEQFKGKRRKQVEQIMHDELKKTYLGDMFEEVAGRFGVSSEPIEVALEIVEPEVAEEVEP